MTVPDISTLPAIARDQVARERILVNALFDLCEAAAASAIANKDDALKYAVEKARGTATGLTK